MKNPFKKEPKPMSLVDMARHAEKKGVDSLFYSKKETQNIIKKMAEALSIGH